MTFAPILSWHSSMFQDRTKRKKKNCPRYDKFILLRNANFSKPKIKHGFNHQYWEIVKILGSWAIISQKKKTKRHQFSLSLAWLKPFWFKNTLRGSHAHDTQVLNLLCSGQTLDSIADIVPDRGFLIVRSSSTGWNLDHQEDFQIYSDFSSSEHVISKNVDIEGDSMHCMLTCKTGLTALSNNSMPLDF